MLGFYTRRIKRLVPSLVLCVLVTGVAVALVNPNPLVSLQTGASALFGLSNLFLLKQATDYFGAAAELNVFTHTWSLGVEEQFYFVYPFLICGSPVFSRQTARGSRYLYWVIIGLALVSLAAFIRLNDTNQPAAYFLMPTRLWELGAGSLLSWARGTVPGTGRVRCGNWTRCGSSARWWRRCSFRCSTPFRPPSSSSA